MNHVSKLIVQINQDLNPVHLDNKKNQDGDEIILITEKDLNISKHINRSNRD